MKLFQYPFSVTPVIDSVDLKIRNKLFIYAGIGEKENQKNWKIFMENALIQGIHFIEWKKLKIQKYLIANYIIKA